MSSDALSALVAAGAWEDALELSSTLGISPSYISQHHYLSLTPSTISPALVTELLSKVDDQEWVAAAALQAARSATTTQVIGAAIMAGLKACDACLSEQEELQALVADTSDGAGERLAALCGEDEAARKLYLIRKGILEVSDRGATWEAVWGASEVSGFAAVEAEVEPEGEGDGWDELDLPSETVPAPLDPATTGFDDAAKPSLSAFLSQPLLDSVLGLAATGELETLIKVVQRHSEELWPSRFDILEAIPEWERPERYLDLLPRAGGAGNEKEWERYPSTRPEDWVERLSLRPPAPTTVSPKLSAVELATYFSTRIDYISSLGLVSVALSLVQYGGSLGVSGLDELGEELSLLSKLVYDRPPPPSSASLADEDLTLDKWRSLSPPAILHSYLAHSTPSTIPSDVRRLVFPYLSVLESRLERAGEPDATLSNRLFYDYVLDLVDGNRLDLLVAIVDASKPTLSMAQRLVKSDEDLARLALACLYGSKDVSSDGLAAMGKIFECLPAFEESPTSPINSSPQDLFHLIANSPSPITPASLFTSLSSFKASSLSNALDALDLHLATAETFLRYSVPAPLVWFLTSHSDEKAQRAWATRMARTSSTGGGGRAGTVGEFESEDEWEGLMEDMFALAEVEEDEQEELKKAFWKLDKEEVAKIFFAGLLGSGKFGLAKALLHPSSDKSTLPPKVEEELVIAASREFYDNAESGNMNKGDMKLAFDCLAIAPQTAEIKKERDLIEATSRLTSFKVYSHPGVPVAPIEIRLSKDRLDFVSRLLASNEDAYRHPDVVLDLVSKLGYRGDRLAEIRALAMIADSGLQAGDFDRTADVCDRMVASVESLRKSRSADAAKVVEEAADVTWRNCYQLGKHEDYRDIDRRMLLLGQALIFCPGNQIATLLPLWTALEARSSPGSTSPSSPRPIPSPNYLAISPTAVASETTAAASRTFTRAAAFFPFGATKAGQEREREATPPQSRSNSHGRQPVRQSPDPGYEGGQRGGSARAGGLSSRLTAGVGWLIGADEGVEEPPVKQERPLHPF